MVVYGTSVFPPIMKFARECLCVSPLVFQDNNCDITLKNKST